MTYTTSEIARKLGIHANTVRLYEDMNLITKPERKANGYRIFTDLHMEQFQIARLALQVEVLQNGLRKQAVEIIKEAARCEFEKAIERTHDYLNRIQEERENAEEAIRIVDQMISGKDVIEHELCLTRKEMADYLHVTIDTLRNWELNGLLTVKRKKNGYRVYTEEDLRLLVIIKSLRCANYSLASILRMLSVLSSDPQADIRDAIDNAQSSEDMITACDSLLTSLNHAETNAREILTRLFRIQKEYIKND